jgi:membrane-associated phospholipid phosphatase
MPGHDRSIWRGYGFGIAPARRTSLLAALSCVGGTVALGVAADDPGPIRRFDLDSVLHFEHRAQTADSVAIVLVHLGDPIVFVVLSAAILIAALCLGRQRESGMALVVLAGANLSTQVLKVVFENPHLLYEPSFESTSTNGVPGRDSFPSGHVTAVASLAVAALFVVSPPHRMVLAALGALATAAVGVSVVALGWHFPTDVLGGLLVVGAWGFAVLAASASFPAQSRAGKTVEGRGARQ